MLLKNGAIRFLSLLLLLSVHSVEAPNQTKFVPSLPCAAQEGAVTGMECEMICSKTKLRTAVAELTWVPSEATLNRQGLEVTVFKNGFEKGPYARLLSMERGQKPIMQQSEKFSRGSMPGLEQLVVVDVRTQRDRLRQDRVTVTVQMEGLEPGLNYYWRPVSNVGGRWVVDRDVQAVRCQAPVCPADMQPNAERP